MNLENQSNIAKNIAKQYFGNITFNLDDILKDIKFEQTTKSSNFDYKTKTIFINLRYIQDINHFVHELFHAISTNYFSDGVQIGFKNVHFSNLCDDLLLETNYGYALNEGATHSFTRDATNNEYGEINPISSYNFCANIFKNLENHMGIETMKLLYIKFGAKEFVKAVTRKLHTTEENVIKLLLCMDAYLDTYRVFHMFSVNYESEDVNSLLYNCYTYLSKIINDKLKFEGKTFDKTKNISFAHLNSEEQKLFNKILTIIDNKELISNNSNISIDEFEKHTLNFYKAEYNKQNITFEELKDEYKNGEFYNFLLLNNYICSNNRIRKDFLKADINEDFTKQIYSENLKAFNIDNELPYNIRTLLSTRYVIRANCKISDYYMTKALNNTEFASYLKNSDKEYYKELLNSSSISKN